MRSSPFLALALGVSLALSAGAAFAQAPEQPQTVSEILQFQHALRAKQSTSPTANIRASTKAGSAA